VSNIYKFFLVIEGKDTAYPNYSDAIIRFTTEDPCNLNINNLLVCSPLFTANEEGVTEIPEISNGTMITFIMMPRIFPDMNNLVREYSITNELWFTLGLANLIIIEKSSESGLAEKIIGYLKNQTNIIASETWVIDNNKIGHHTLPFSETDHKKIQVEQIDLDVSEKLPLHIKFAVSEFKLSANKFLTASKKFTPYYYKRHSNTIIASTQLVHDLSFLHGDYNFEPDDSLLSEMGAKNKSEAEILLSEAKLNFRKEELINDRNGRLIQFNSSLSYVYSQAYSGIFPLFDHIGIIQRHSLLGVGTAIASLTELLGQVEGGLFFLPFEEISNTSYATSNIYSEDFFSCFQETYFHSPLIWQKDALRIKLIKDSDPQKNSRTLPDDFFNRLSFFSGRLGFREYDLSATAAVQVLAESNSLQWNVINYTHEIIHNHVRIILNQLIVPATSLRTEKYDEWLKANLIKLELVFKSIIKRRTPTDLSYQDYFTLILIKYCINSQYYGSLSRVSNQVLLEELRADSSKKAKYKLPTPLELNELVIHLYKDITEIFVHVLDYCYIYTRNIETYLQSIWSSWSTVITVSNDLKQYILRTLVVIGLTENGDIEYRFTKSKQVFVRLLEKIASHNGNAYLFSRIKDIISNHNDVDLKDRFCNCIIVADMAYNYFVGELETYFDNHDNNRLGKFSDEAGNNFVYNIERNTFQGDKINSKVRFLLDQLIRETVDSTSNYDDDYKERTSAWLLLSLSSIN
jgi:hypothetical protein